jgi:hypothetical protein
MNTEHGYVYKTSAALQHRHPLYLPEPALIQKPRFFPSIELPTRIQHVARLSDLVEEDQASANLGKDLT